MLVFFHRIGHEDQISIKLIQVFCKIPHQHHIDRIARFHIRRTATKHPFSRLNIRQDLWVASNGLDLLWQGVAVKGVLLDGAVVIDTHSIVVAVEDDSFVAVTTGTKSDGDHVDAVIKVVL